jgi:DNA-binding GntR family transcriptional regulator
MSYIQEGEAVSATARVPSKQERAYAVLRGRILDGSYGPGYRLVIDAIARELKVSPMPVREAIRRLEAEGWVIYPANQGARVAPLDTRSWKDVMITLALLEGYATAAAAPEIAGEDLGRLRAINDEMRVAVEMLDPMLVAEHNHAFHGLIYERCPNAYLRPQLALTMEILNTLRSTIFIYIPTRGHESAAEHDEMIEAIEAGAAASKLERLARHHKLRTVAAYEARLAQGVPTVPGTRL